MIFARRILSRECYFTELRPVVPQVLIFRGPMESKRFSKASRR
jgi:hypothetical protein